MGRCFAVSHPCWGFLFSHTALCAWLGFAGKSTAALKSCTQVTFTVSELNLDRDGLAEVESACAGHLNCVLMCAQGGWCACEQNEITGFALFHLLSCSSDQALVTTRANTRIQVLENCLPQMKGQKKSTSSRWQSLKSALLSFWQ